MVDEVNLARALHSVAVTLNDQRLEAFEASRVQAIADGATGGTRMLVAYGSGTSGELRAESIEGERVARLTLEDGTWSVERLPEARKSQALEQAEEQRSKQKEAEYQKPVRGRYEIWKKKVSGG